MDFKNFYKKIVFDIDRDYLQIYEAKQGDTKSRGFYVTVTQNNVEVPIITESMTFYAEKPDGTRVYQDAVKDKGKFRIDLKNQVFAVLGIVKCELTLKGANCEKISSKAFKIKVHENLTNNIVSKDERGIIDDALELAEDIIPRIELLDVDLLENYQSEVEQNKVKISTVEKELNDYKKTIQQVNINQEAKQEVSGYGIVNLPPNAASGQVSGNVKGETRTNLAENSKMNIDSNDDGVADNWMGFFSSRGNYTVTEEGQKCEVIDDSGRVGIQYQHDNLKKANTISVSFKVKGEGFVIIEIRERYTSADDTIRVIVNQSEQMSLDSTFKTIKLENVAITTENLDAQIILMFVSDIKNGDYFIATDCVVEKNNKAGNYIEGTKSALASQRIKSIGRNLFNTDNLKLYYDKGPDSLKILNKDEFIVSSNREGWYRARKFIQLAPNTQYALSYYSEIIDGNPYEYVVVIIGDSLYYKTFTTDDTGIIEIRGYSGNDTLYGTIKYKIQIEKGDIATEYEPYKEDISYVTVKDKDNKIVNLNRINDNIYDELDTNEMKTYKKTGEIKLNGNMSWNVVGSAPTSNSLTLSTTISNISIGTRDSLLYNNYGKFRQFGNTGLDEPFLFDIDYRTGYIFVKVPITTGSREDGTNYLNNNPLTLIYQLAEPEILPVQVSGSVISHPNGTIYVEPITTVAGVYNSNMLVTYDDLPIKEIEKITKIDYETGLGTDLDVSAAVIAEDGLSFTHPDLSNGDIVFFEYFYDVETTQGECIIEYYDSRYVIKDKTTGQFYKWNVVVDNGTPSIELEEV